MAENNHIEQWNPIKDFEGRYEVSDRGLVKSLNYNNTGAARILKTDTDPAGYPRVSLSQFGKVKSHRVHILVLEAFVGPRPPGLVCDHIDNDKDNNRVGNLRWCTQSENVLRGRSPTLSRLRCGSKNYSAKLNEAEVIQIRKRYAQGGITQRKLAGELGVCQALVSRIASRQRWKHV